MRIVSLIKRPDLAETTGTWRWGAFFKEDGEALADVIARENACASSRDPIPAVLVLLDQAEPIGMVTLCLDDLDGRPELNPWLAGLYVVPAFRGKGHGLCLISEIEALALRRNIKRLSLYTASAVGLYDKAGWSTIETFAHGGTQFSIMQKQLD